MHPLTDILPGKIGLDIECVDRVYLNGYVKYLQMAGGLVNFIREQLHWPIPSPQALSKMSDGFRKAVDEFAAQQGLEIVTFKRGDDKDAIARARLVDFAGETGVVLIGKAQEKASAFKGRRADQGTKVWFVYSRQPVNVVHFYFYILDREFGLCFIKVCTYLPFEVKVYINGHEWAKQQLRKEGIGFEALSNGFATCEDPARLQAICHQLDTEKIQALFDRWVEQLPWPLTPAQRAAGYHHQLSVWQLEVSRTQVFVDADQGRALVEGLIRDNLDLGRPDRVSLIFDRQVTKRTPSEFHTRVIREGVLPCIRIRYKHSGLKQYFKDGRALRTEMTINNPQDFDVNRGLANFRRLVELGRGINQRLLDHERISQDWYLPLDEVRRLGESTVGSDGQRASAVRFGDPRTMAVLAALACHAFIPGELRNYTLRRTVTQLWTGPGDYTAARMSYDLRRLRLKGLIERLPRSHRYILTRRGVKVVTFYTKLHERMFRPGLAALVDQQVAPSPLAEALEAVVAALGSLSSDSSTTPVAAAA
jgi:hypothetical protein